MGRNAIVSVCAGAVLLTSIAAGAVPAVASTTTCDVSFAVDAAAPLGGVGLRVSYASAGGTFAGTEGNVACVSLAPAAFGLARDDDQAGELELGMIAPGGLAVPATIWRCTFESSAGTPSAESFVLTIDDAIDVEGATIPAIASVSDIVCLGPPVCGNSVIEAPEECDDGGPSSACDGSCNLTAGSQRCDVVFRVTGENPIGGVQFNVGYENAQGEFQGLALGVSCTKLLPYALSTVYDVDVARQLRLAMVSPAELTLPIEPWKCTFVSSGVPILLKNFNFEEIVASDSTLGTVPVKVGARLTNCVRPYCGDGNVGSGEACDDGNDDDSDNCTNTCTIARCGDSVIRGGVEQCDDGNTVSGDCCSPACMFEAATTVCRTPAGICDQSETCNGTSAICPADVKMTSLCRPAQGVCDIAESCNGTSNDCGPDLKTNITCRPATGECDVTEVCNGINAACPANAFQPPTLACTSDGNGCTTDRCSGSGSCIHANNNEPCDDGLFCNGSDSCGSGSCMVHAGNPCPGADGDSDCSETCLEAADSCTANDADSSACNDGNSQTIGDQCLDGQCVGGTGAVCGDADGNGTITASDALRALRKSVGQPVTCPLSRCDTDHNGVVQSGDALRILRKSVGQAVMLSCPI